MDEGIDNTFVSCDHTRADFETMTIATASDLDDATARLLLMPLISAVACVALAGCGES